jgi:hypothetical protein
VERISPEAGQQARPEPRPFEELVARLEAAECDELSGAGLRRCRDAYQEHPWAFANLVLKIERRADARSPLGLLVRAVTDGDHRRIARVMDRGRSDARGAAVTAPSIETTPAAPTPGPAVEVERRPCVDCGDGYARTGAELDGEWLCGRHFGLRQLTSFKGARSS